MALLPEHVEPMLARIGPPFDSAAHLFEIKWDGVRALTYVEASGHRMHGRRRRDLRTRYPELEFLSRLPAGTLLDGELVVLQADGRPDFPAILSRENAKAARIAGAARQHPVVYVVFDLLYERGQSLLDRPLRERRERLTAVVAEAAAPRLMVSEGVAGEGLKFFAAVQTRQLEGMVGKRLDSPYRPGERTEAWIKVKPIKRIHCLILGFEPDGPRDFKSLIVATDFEGALRCVGRVAGFTDAVKARLRELLFARLTAAPLIDAGMSGRWVEPGLYCSVDYLELTANGQLRGPVFVELLPE